MCWSRAQRYMSYGGAAFTGRQLEEGGCRGGRYGFMQGSSPGCTVLPARSSVGNPVLHGRPAPCEQRAV